MLYEHCFCNHQMIRRDRIILLKRTHSQEEEIAFTKRRSIPETTFQTRQTQNYSYHHSRIQHGTKITGQQFNGAQIIHRNEHSRTCCREETTTEKRKREETPRVRPRTPALDSRSMAPCTLDRREQIRFIWKQTQSLHTTQYV